MGVLDNLQPKSVFYFFEQISQIPRGSGNQRAISDYIVEFAKQRGLNFRQDETYNVLVTKDGTKGFENAPSVIFQGHIDMVCKKGMESKHDFLTEPLTLKIDGNYVHADNTTLGADNGIAVAYMLAILDSKDIEHPPIEAIFTTDEEIGMLGAYAFDASDLKGKTFINIDTDEEGKFIISCSGGQRAEIQLPIERENSLQENVPYILEISGLLGGHSGADIHLQRANANKLLGRVLHKIYIDFKLKVASISGGSVDNAISSNAEAVLLVKTEDTEKIQAVLEEIQSVFRNEYQAVQENSITISMRKLQEKVEKVFTDETTKKAIDILLLIPYGVITVSFDEKIKGLVESSNNIGVVKTTDTDIIFLNAIRSSVVSKKHAIYEQIEAIARLTGAKSIASASYPAWELKENSKIVSLFESAYQEIFNKIPKIQSIHAGLECGVFSEKIKDLDAISIGPNIIAEHTEREALDIASVTRMWELIKEVLKRMK